MSSSNLSGQKLFISGYIGEEESKDTIVFSESSCTCLIWFAKSCELIMWWCVLPANGAKMVVKCSAKLNVTKSVLLTLGRSCVPSLIILSRP